MDQDDQPVTQRQLTEALTAAENRIETRIVDRLTETMRDAQTEILRGLERFSRGNFARMHRLES
jgi:hypothetical protein